MDGDGGGFHRTEAISAVQDEEQFYGEDEDYEDLYNDVNVGEGFYQQPLESNEKGTTEELVNVPPPPQPHQLPPPPEKPQISPDVKAHEPSLPPSQQQLPPPPQAQFQQGGNFAEGNSNSFNGGGSNFNNGGGANFTPGSGGNFPVGGGGGGGTTTLFVGDLHWWTTDTDLESELVKYGPVKEVKFFDEKASGKSKGYAQVDFYDPAVATACKENMNGHLFNGRPCVVAFSSPYSIRRMGEAQVSRNLQGTNQNQNMNGQNQNMNGQNQPGMVNKARANGPPMGGGNNNFGGRGVGNGSNWARGGGMGGMGGRGGPMGNMRNNRMGPMGGGRGMIGNNGMVGPPPQMMHPGMLGPGFDYGGMGRMGGGFGGFPGPMGGPYPGMMPPYRPVVAPHVNPAFFGRGMQGGVPGMWQDPNMGGWGGEEQSSYGEDAGSEHQYGGDGGVTHGKERERVSERGGSERRHEREKDVGVGQEFPERRHRGEDRERERSREYDRERERERSRDKDRERERHRDDRDRHGDHHGSRHRDRERERDVDRDEDWDRGKKGRSRSREVETVKRRRGSE